MSVGLWNEFPKVAPEKPQKRRNSVRHQRGKAEVASTGPARKRVNHCGRHRGHHRITRSYALGLALCPGYYAFRQVVCVDGADTDATCRLQSSPCWVPCILAHLLIAAVGRVFSKGSLW
jgi:hypothetical protein